MLDVKLGLYDARANTWVVKDVYFPFSADLTSVCFLMKADSELISVFFGEEENLVGFYVLDFAPYEWREVKHMGNRTLFVGMEASLIVENSFETPNGASIINGEAYLENPWSLDWMIDEGKFTRTDFICVWVKPKCMKFGLDQVMGRTIHPMLPV